MMPRLFPAEAPKRRWYRRLLINVGIGLLTAYGLLILMWNLLPIVRERMEANRAARAIAFRDRISVNPQRKIITTAPTPSVAPSAPATRVKTIPQSYTLSSTIIPPSYALSGTRNRASMAVPARTSTPTSIGPFRRKSHPKVVRDSDPDWYIFVPPGDAQHKSPDPSAPFARWMQGEGFTSARECEHYREQVVIGTVYERDHNEELSTPYDYKIKLFANAKCVSMQNPRLIQTR
jgi:hypothetical protein